MQNLKEELYMMIDVMTLSSQVCMIPKGHIRLKVQSIYLLHVTLLAKSLLCFKQLAAEAKVLIQLPDDWWAAAMKCHLGKWVSHAFSHYDKCEIPTSLGSQMRHVHVRQALPFEEKLLSVSETRHIGAGPYRFGASVHHQQFDRADIRCIGASLLRLRILLCSAYGSHS